MDDPPRPTSPPPPTGRSTPASARPPERRKRAVGWGTGDVLRAAALVIFLYLLLRLIWFANALFFVVFLGVLFGLAVGAAATALERFRIPRGVGAAITVLGFFAVLVGMGALMAPTIRTQARELREKLPQAVEQFENWLDDRREGTMGFLVRGLMGPDETADSAVAAPEGGDSAAGERRDSQRAADDTGRRDTAAADTRQGDTRSSEQEREPAAQAGRSDEESVSAAEQPGISVRERLGSQLGGVSSYLFRFLSSTVAVLSGIALVIFLSIYIGASPDLYHRGLLHLFPHHIRPRMGEVLSSTATMLRRWLITQLIGMVVIGVVTTVVLLVLGVEAAFALGLLAGLLEFIPTIGPLLSAVPAIAMGFLDSPQMALYVAIAYMLIQFVESNLLMPLLMHEGVDIPPALSIVFQALMALVFGFLGLLAAVPLLAAAMVPIKMLYVEDVVGDDVEVPGDEDDDDGDANDSSSSSTRA